MCYLVQRVGEQLCHLLQIMLVGIVESSELFAVDVENGNGFARLREYGHYDFRPRKGAASDVSRELFHVGNNQGAPHLKRLATHALTNGDGIAGWRTLKRPKRNMPSG